VIERPQDGVVVLVDTSVWIEFFRQSSRFDLQAIIDLEEIVTCPPVIQEVLQGFDNQRSFLLAREAMLAFPMVEEHLTLEVYLEAAELFRSAQRAGLTVRSGVDCLIATCAIRNSLTLLHRDRDFDALARVAPLSVLESEL